MDDHRRSPDAEKRSTAAAGEHGCFDLASRRHATLLVHS